MVGGSVIGIARSDESTLLHVQERQSGDTLSIRVVERRADDGSAVHVRLGDQVWWQSRWAMWTTPGGQEDVQLPRIGYSH